MIKDIIKKFIPSFLLGWYHLALPFSGAVFYGFPAHLRPWVFGGQAKKIKVIGVTGTNGKSTVVLMITKILEEAGFKTASLSSINFKIRDKEWANPLKMTMPGRFKIQKFLRQAVNAGCQYVVLEVTSEGIKQHRHKFINFDTVVFTNLSAEHIERHGSFEKYKEAKGKLFQACKNIHIINRDDSAFNYFWNFPANKKIQYQVSDGNKGYPISIKFNGYRISFILSLELPGEFNLYNAAAAISVGLSQGIDISICKKAVGKIESIPGRMELVIREPFKVIVDYAHTPDALEKVYQTIISWTSDVQLRTSDVQQRMICVLGSAGGGRDKWKRPELGKIAAKYCDEVMITNEDPYNEPPEKIIDDIAKTAPNAQKILDRREAIEKALTLAGCGDTVIITGKGCEPWMCVKDGKKIPWSDKKLVLDTLKKRNIIT